MSLVILRQAVDTLHASVAGHVIPDLLECLAEAKAKAQENESPQPLEVNGQLFAVEAFGSTPYAYKLTSETGALLLTGSEKIAGASVQLSAKGLAMHKPQELVDSFLGHAAFFGPVGPAKLSRIDIAVDFQGIDLSELGDARFVCPARFRPIYPSVDDPETYQFGKDRMVVRVYNKTKELKKSGKLWMKRLWAEHPDYDPSADVWRFEVQLRRDRLRELSIDAPEEGMAAIRKLLFYGLFWCTLKIARGDKHERWPVHPAWEQLMEATGEHTVIERSVIKAELSDLSRIVPAVAGYAVSAAAVLENYDQEEVLGILLDKVRAHMDAEEFEAAARARHLERLG